LLYWHLNALNPAGLPKPVLAQLWGVYETTARRNQALTAELLRLLELLERHGIPALPFKGPALAAAVYGNLALRQFEDLDILVRRSDALKAKALLVADGYRPAFPLGPAQEARLLQAKIQYHFHLRQPDRHLLVELHWRVAGDYFSFPTEADPWWANLGTTTLAGATVRCFAPAELLLLLCLHGAKHHWASLAWLADLAGLIQQQPRLDWERVWQLTDQIDGRRMLCLGLFLAHQLLGAPLPAAVWAGVAAEPEIHSLAGRISQTLFQANPPEPGAVERLAFALSLLKHRLPRLQYARAILLDPQLTELSRWRLPARLFFLYFPLRWLRLVSKYSLGRMWG
jgi:hypothetical protein